MRAQFRKFWQRYCCRYYCFTNRRARQIEFGIWNLEFEFGSWNLNFEFESNVKRKPELDLTYDASHD